jgi:hypothetical protein
MTGEELSVWIWIWFSYSAAFVVGLMAGIGIAQRMRAFLGYCPWVAEEKCVYLDKQNPTDNDM